MAAHFSTSVSNVLFGNIFLQTASEFNLYAVASVRPIIHQQEVSVVVIEAGQSTLAAHVH